MFIHSQAFEGHFSSFQDTQKRDTKGLPSRRAHARRSESRAKTGKQRREEKRDPQVMQSR